MKCEDCSRRICLDVPEFQWSHWLKLSHLLEFLRAEASISNATYEAAVDALLIIKPPIDHEFDFGERKWRVSEQSGKGYSIDTEPETSAGHVFLFYQQAEALHDYMHRREDG